MTLIPKNHLLTIDGKDYGYANFNQKVDINTKYRMGVTFCEQPNDVELLGFSQFGLFKSISFCKYDGALNNNDARIKNRYQ